MEQAFSSEPAGQFVIRVSEIENPEIRHYLRDRNDSESVAKGFVMLAQEAEQKKEWQKAAALYGQVLNCKPADPVIRYCGTCGRGYCQAQMGSFESAARNLADAININPDFCHAYRLLGFTMERLGRYKEAVQSYLSAILKKPDDKESWDYLMNAIAMYPKIYEEIDNLPVAVNGARSLLERSGAWPKNG